MPDLFNLCKNHTAFKLVDKNLKKKQFAVYDSHTPVTLKQGQGHQTWCALVDPKQGYNNAKFEQTCLKNVCKNTNDTVFVK